MRCYRVDEDVHTGIYLKKVADNLCIEVGEDTVPLDEAYSSVLLNTKQRVVDMLKGCMITGEVKGKPISNEEKAMLESIVEYVEPESVQLIYADVGSGNDIVRESHRSPDALVLIETAAGPNGGISFLSNTYDEVVDNKKRVKRRYRSAFPPPGITVVKEGRSAQGSKCFLLRMIPNSSVRIERTGALEGEPSILTIVWKGRVGKAGSPPLLMFSPDRRQEA